MARESDNKMKEIQAPNNFKKAERPFVFLAGSIEMNKAIDWQNRATKALSDVSGTILNPRRKDWDSSWKQEASDPQFRKQVEWELDAQEQSDLILMFFDPKTKSPITLMELGLFHKKSMIVCCPEPFYRKGNVDIVCERYNIKQANSFEELIKMAEEKLLSHKYQQEIRG